MRKVLVAIAVVLSVSAASANPGPTETGIIERIKNWTGDFEYSDSIG